MLEFDRMSYIFGSFARRRQSQEVSSAKRPSKIVHDRSKSTPNPKKTVTISSPRSKSVYANAFSEGKFKCSMCLKEFVDPRVLPCLHTFCLKCLQGLDRTSQSLWYDEEGSKTGSPDSRKASSGGSGYGSDSNKSITCPTCGFKTDVPPGGVDFLPPNYTLQHKMVLATLNAHTTHLLCDLCTSEVTAVSRCTECALSFCSACEEIHLKQKSCSEHEVLSLEEARRRGITKIRRQIMCIQHPDLELTIFCSSCSQVICRDCLSTLHRGHTCEPISRVAKNHYSNLRMAVDKAKSVMEQTAIAASRLHITSKKIENQCNKVQSDVEKFIESYIRSVEEHKMNLLEQIKQVKEEKLEAINQEKQNLQRRIREARDIAYFLDDLLNDATDVEVLSFVKPVSEKLENCTKESSNIRLSGSVQFLPEETVQCSNSFFTLHGVISTQNVSAQHCTLITEGLQNLRVGKKAEVILETKDCTNMALDRGGEVVTAEIRYRDAGVSRSLNVKIEDKRDGTYGISFVPDVAGKLVLSVFVRGESIKDNPFPFNVRSLKPHHGTFHCCTFCSSGGSKEALCGCEGRMPGGYKGCGHGHEGHPGKRHWSCCGNTLEHSECSRTNSHYQFTL